jgi:hypothetical protein
VGINDAALRVDRGRADQTADDSAWARLKTRVRESSALLGLLRRFAPQPREGSAVFAAHKLLMPQDRHYLSREPAADIDALVARSSAAFRERMKRIVALVQRQGALPICVSQPSIVYRRFDDGWRGLPDAFTFEGRSFNGLDFRRSILALNQVMAEECVRAGGHYIDLERRPFETSDYYDAAHMSAQGAEKVASYLFEEFVTQGVAARWQRQP